MYIIYTLSDNKTETKSLIFLYSAKSDFSNFSATLQAEFMKKKNRKQQTREPDAYSWEKNT